MIADYLLLSLAPAALALVVGGAIGYGYAALARRMFQAAPAVRRWAALIPWRAAVFALPLLVLVTMLIPLIVLDLGLGFEAGFAAVGLTVLLFAIPLTSSAFLQRWFPRGLRGRLWAAGRSLLVASTVLAVFTAQGGASPVGRPFFASTGFDAAYAEFLIVFGLALAVDVLLGIGEALMPEQIGAL